VATVPSALCNDRSEIVSVHPDWITATAKDPDKRERLRGLCIDWATAQSKTGSEWATWQWQGYTGLKCGQVSFGERGRDDCSIVRVSGALAGSTWREIAALASNCSRLDLAVTVRLESYQGDIAATSYREACAAARERGTELHVSMIVSNHGGGTAYLGSRKSELFGRIYDKERESGDGSYKSCWRWEVECKGNRALTYLRQLAIGGDERPHIQRVVGSYFTERGVSLPWDAGDSCGLRGPVLVETDDDRRLSWLSDQVRASVGGLINRGRRAAVLEALGLSLEDSRHLRENETVPGKPVDRSIEQLSLREG
jgi:hypothetical protein